MKLTLNILSTITILLLLSTMICGFWIKSNNVVEASSLQFHAVIGILSIIFVVVLIIVFKLAMKN